MGKAAAGDTDLSIYKHFNVLQYPYNLQLCRIVLDLTIFVVSLTSLSRICNVAPLIQKASESFKGPNFYTKIQTADRKTYVFNAFPLKL